MLDWIQRHSGHMIKISYEDIEFKHYYCTCLDCHEEDSFIFIK